MADDRIAAGGPIEIAPFGVSEELDVSNLSGSNTYGGQNTETIETFGRDGSSVEEYHVKCDDKNLAEQFMFLTVYAKILVVLLIQNSRLMMVVKYIAL